jgi:heme-degrading monooxygenase HmoA
MDQMYKMRRNVAKGSEAAFERVRLSRDSHLDKVPGFVEFHLLKGPAAEDHTLCAFHTAWETVLCLKRGPTHIRGFRVIFPRKNGQG